MADRYRLVESIGQGGMGRVWRATDEMLDRQIAVKEMRIDGHDPEDSRTRRERTLREARATARIDHPGVVRVHDVVDAGERLWIVMELVDGRSLERLLAEDGPLDAHDTARIGLELVDALGQVHAQGVLHRDIKPANVLIRRKGTHRAVLTDFGIAAIQNAEALTMAGMLVGSPDYMAPERVTGRPQGPPSDLWSLGATLCAALGGRSPFARSTTLATLHAVLYEAPELPAAAGPLQHLLAALLDKDPEARPTLPRLTEALRAVTAPPAPPDTGEGRPTAERPTPPATTAHPPTAITPHPEARPPSPVRAPTPTARSTPPPDRATTPVPPGELPGSPVPSGRTKPDDPTSPVPPRRRNRRIGLVAAAAVAVTAVVAAVVVPAMNGSPGDKDKHKDDKASSPSSPAGPSPTPTVAGTSRPPKLPPGARTEAGVFAWVPPDGFSREVHAGAEVHYTSPDARQEIVGKASLARGDLLEQWRKKEKSTSEGPGYQRIRLEETEFRGEPAVVWEYTVMAQELPWHVRSLGFNTGGKSYQLTTWYHPDIEDRALPVYEKVEESFTVPVD
ncbi:protein kinase domain-containing protein [Streptomyces sp. FxanaA7]|uniref:protein kinase domain-containing protein n=1 Tax=Streptomyces sp. FxanaA7 TaxID=1265492 RepID=UPI002D21ECF7|nr:protein kinase [Streptomyces sp. FxanaA7]